MSGSRSHPVPVPPDRGRYEDQPLWRQDFPIDVPQDQHVARREFVKFMVLISGAFAAGQFWILYLSSLRSAPAPVAEKRIATLDEIPVGGTLPFEFPTHADPCFLIRPDETTLLAYDSRCTHLACPVIPQLDRNRLHCPCHAGAFDVRSGVPIAGPPRRPLPRITLSVRDGVVYATGVELRT